MGKISKVYQYVDGTNDLPFPNATNQLEIKEFTYDAKRMGGAPTISASVKYPTCLDDEWTGKEYVDFRGEKYVIKQTPSSSYSNEDNRYRHDVTFVSERIILDNTYFYDVVTDPTDVDKYVSNSSKVIFFGDIHEFAKRLDYSLKYSKVGYTVVVDKGISTGGFTMSFEDQFFSQVLQSIFEVYGIPYYFVGKVIHIGYTNNAITRTFKYGVDDALLSISKTNANYKIVNRITGAGSADNIPYYYPNPSEDRAAIEAAGGKWITPSDKLMPPIYRQSLGAERFYNAENGTYKDPITGEYYIFENEYVDGNPKEHKVSFDHIKPTIKEMVNASGLRMDMFQEFDYDLTDNDETDTEGKYIHPYFFGKLRRFDGVNGFNLFDHTIEEDEMIISMTSGSCGACNFVIGVDDETQKNLVQIHTNGQLLRDKEGNVIRTGEPQSRQNDTIGNEVWVALRKDTDTFGVLMPNAANNYKPNASTDTFVILHIDLPKAYITSAENKLKEEIIKYMATNNSDKFNFSINFSRIFFAENPDILSLLNENARLQIEYNKKLYELYISSYSYKMSSNEPLPQITVELSDTLTINKGTLQTSIDAVKQDIMSSIGGGDFLKQGLKYFVRKDVSDYAKFVEFREGIDVGGFESLLSGGTFRKDIDGKSYIEVDRLYVRLKAIFENLEIKRTTYVGGEQIASPAAMKCIKVEDQEIIVDPETEEETIIVWDYYRCYYLNEQEGVKIQNEFVIGDQAICKEANLASGSNVSNQYYWRLVVGVGDGYIDLSKTDCDTASTIPSYGDDIVQLGNRTDVTRQKAIIQSTVSLDAPSIKLLAGINSFSLEGKAIISMGFDSLTGKATFNVYGNAYIGNPDGSSFIKYTPEGGVEINAKLSIGTTIGDNGDTIIDKINQAKQEAIDVAGKELTDYAATVTKDLDDLQNQIDGAIETWFEDPIPTLTNKPAIDWNTIELKNLHLGDIYYSGEGKIYRFQMEGTSYVWKEVIDTELAKALELAKKAQDTADGKRKVFVRQPLNTEDYAIGDLWVNATFATIYKNDLLRCKTAKAANVAFNIVHWELASKYTDDTKALEAAKAASDAQYTADAAKAASDKVAESVSDLNTYVDGAFKDGLITETEAQVIANYINTINNNKLSADGLYAKLYANVYLTGTAKTNLASSKTALDTATINLLSSINAAIKDGRTTVAEKEDVDAKFALYNTANGTFSTRVEEANKAIQDKLKTYSDEASAAAATAAVAAGNAQKSANEANAAVGSLNTYIDGAFKDGVVSEAEAAAIEKYINSVNNTKSEVKATFDKLYANVYLSGTAKTDLNAKYTALNTSITNLLASINAAIADGKTTTAEKTDVDAKFALFNTAYAAFSTAIETANKAIQDKLKDYSDAASEAASNAQSSANSAQSSANTANNLLSDIASDSKLTASEKQETKKEWDIIVSEKPKNDASADFYGVSKTAYGTAYAALNTYIAPLLASLTTTSDIVGTTFRSTFKTYYDARTDLLNSIAKKAKQIADAAQDSANSALENIAGYEYIKKALGQPKTEIQNGLILTSLVSLGYKPSESEDFNVMSGINGIYDATKPGNGISYWAGGAMKDLAEDYPLPWQPNTPPKPTDPSKYAKSVVRMDGTVYFAGGNMWIDIDGKIHCDPLSFFVGEEQVGEILTLFTPITTGIGAAKKVVGIRQNQPFEDGTGKGRLLIGKHILSEDSNGYLSLTKGDGTPANFYTSGGFSALGLSPDIGGGGGSGGVYSIFLGDVEYPSSNGVVRLPAYPVVTELSWNNITNKPLWIGATKPSYVWDEIVDKPTTFVPSAHNQSISTITDVNSAWQTMLKIAPAVYNTRWAAWGDVTGKPSWIESSKPSYNFNEISNIVIADNEFNVVPSGYDDGLYINHRSLTKGVANIKKYFFKNGNTGYAPIVAESFVKNGGTSSQFLKADGSIDSNPYITVSSVTWANLANKPATATRWATWSEVTSKPSWIGSSKPTYTYSEVGAEAAFSKNTAFNKNFGTAASTVAQGNDSRINNGQTAYSWGNHANVGYARLSLVGAASGIAPLDENKLIPSSYLPSYVDDVLEYASFATLPTKGEAGKIYVTTNTNITYRWSGTAYVEISKSLALGETSSTAYAGDKGKANATAIAALRAISISAGSGLTGGGNLTASRTINIVSANDGITINADNIQLNTINALTSTSATKPLSAAQGKRIWDSFTDMFEKVNVGTSTAPIYAIKAKYGLYTEQFLSAMGLAPDLGGEGSQGIYTVYIGDVAYNSSEGVVKLPAYPVVTELAWDNVTGKPTWIGSIKPSYTKAEVGLGSVDNTADSAKNVLSATKLTTARTINGVSFNGTANITITAAPNAHNQAWSTITGTPTTIAGYGITNAVLNTDARLTDARNAKDVYAWAKASAKPKYDFSELTGYTLGSLLTYKADANTLYVNNKLTSYNNIYPDSPNLFPANNNANGIIDVPTHIAYSHQLGFSNYGAFHHRVRTAGTWSSWREISHVDWVENSFVSLTTAQTISGSKTFSSNVTAPKFIKAGGAANQLLRADGGVDTFNWIGQIGQPNWLWGGNAQRDYYVYNPSNFNVYSSNILNVIDIRSTTPKPADKSDNTVSSWFNNTGTPNSEWWGGISVKGWASSEYEVWELAGPATSTNTKRSLHYRSGNGSTWNAWQTILDSSNYAGIADSRYVKKSGDTMTGDLNIISNHIIYFNNNANFSVGSNGTIGTYLKYNTNILAVRSDNVVYNGNTVWHAGNDGSGSGLDADLLDGLHVHTGRNNEANKVVRTDGSGYIQAGYINISNGHEKNLSNPTYVWGANSTDGYVRSYSTSYLHVAGALNSDKLDGLHLADIPDYVNNSCRTWLEGSNATPTTNTAFFTELRKLGFFRAKASFDRAAWYYANTPNFNTGQGNLDMAGTAVWSILHNNDNTTLYKSMLFLTAEGSLFSYVGEEAGVERWNRYAKITDNIASATKLQTARTINGTSFDGTSNITTNSWGATRTLYLTGNAAGSIGINGSNNVTLSVTNNYAANAGKLETARTINGTSFDGTANIVTSYWGTARTLSAGTDCSGSVSVNGSGNFTLPITVNTATKLRTSRTIWGQSFNGTGNVSGALTGVSTISASGGVTTGARSTFTGGIRALIGSTDDWSSAAIFAASSYPLVLYNPAGDANTRKYYFSIGNNSMALATANDSNNLVSTFALFSHNGSVKWEHTNTFNKKIVASNGIRAGYTNDSYRISTDSFICNNWVRTTRGSGWYSETYGGGIHMGDSIWVRVYNDKKFYVANKSADAIHTGGGVKATGSGYFGGALTAAGATTLSSTLTVSGATTLKSTLTVTGVAQFNGAPKTSKWWYSTGSTGWYNETYSGGIYQTDSDQVRVYNNKVLYNDGYRVWGIKGHHCGLKLYQASHIGINLANSKFTWGIYSNSNGRMYIGRRTGDINNSSGDYIVEIGATDFLMYGTMKVAGSFTSLSDITADGDILAKGGMTALTSASDIRLKEQLTTYNALPVINSLRSVAYKWNDKAKNYADVFKTDAIQFGLIAQELQAMFPMFVKNMFDEYLTIDYERLIPIAWRGIQELSEISNNHESRLDKLERENRELKKEVKQLKEKCYGKD